MDARHPTPPVIEPPTVPAERLYRMAPETYHGLIEHGLIAPQEIALVDGLLVQGSECDGPSEPSDRLYRMPLDVYHRVADAGLLGPGDKTELLDGLLLKKMTKGDPHIIATHLTRDALAAAVPGGWFVLKEDPVALPTGPSRYASEPEPDLAVVRGAIRDYLGHKPKPEDVALIVEVAETSLRWDRSKLTRYAWANVPVAWIVNLNDRVVEVYSNPTGPVAPARYQDVTTYGPDDHAPVVVDGREVGRVAVAGLLP